MFLIKIYIKESYINYYHTIIQMCGQYCILDVVTSLWLGNIALPKELFNVLSLHGNILLN